jgi:hypothetical protein
MGLEWCWGFRTEEDVEDDETGEGELEQDNAGTTGKREADEFEQQRNGEDANEDEDDRVDQTPE